MLFKLLEEDESINWEAEIGDFLRFCLQLFWGAGWASTVISVILAFFGVFFIATNIRYWPYLLAAPIVGIAFWFVLTVGGTIMGFALKLFDDEFNLSTTDFEYEYSRSTDDFKSLKEEIDFGKKWNPISFYFILPIKTACKLLKAIK